MENSGIDSLLIQEVRRIELRTRLTVDAALLGSYRSSFRGSGLVFSDLREYQPGDDVKHIHWRATARTGKVYVKSYEEERSLEVLLLVDRSASLAAGSPRSSFARAAEFSALVSLLCSRSQDAVGLSLFSDSVEEYIPPRRGRKQPHAIISTLLKPRPFSRGTDISVALRYARERLKRASIVFIVSDFFSPPFVDELQLLSRRHDVVLVTLDDRTLAHLPSAGIVEFEDAESGETLVLDTGSRTTREFFEQRYEVRLSRLRDVARNTGADLMPLTENPVRALSELMRARVARMR